MLIDIQSLRLQIDGTPVLRNVNLSVNEGEIYGLLGPNGAGKSTTIAVALGLRKPDAGSVRVLGEDPRAHPEAVHARVGVLPEQGGFYGWMTARDYLGFFARLYGKELDTSVLSARLEQVGLDPKLKRPIDAYSRGMKQRLGLARALLPEPRLLILDEPTNGLDPRGRHEIHDLLRDLSANRNVGILLCTHLLDDVDRLCHRIGIIVAGETVAQGAMAELLNAGNRPTRFRLRLAGTPPAAIPAAVRVVTHEGEWWLVDIAPDVSPDAAWRQLLFAGWPVAEIHRAGGGMEDLYLALTERRAA
ncbi:MAG: ABC transporter ATP-binding protein [Limisphaerales bacterium]